MSRYNHKEAFCLMKYQTDDGAEEEMLWNSRDGVTPFCIRNRDGTKEMTHVDWGADQCVPGHAPAIGDRIFIDHTEETAKAAAEQMVKKWWDDPTMPMKNHDTLGPLGKEGAIARFAGDYMGDVTVVEWTGDFGQTMELEGKEYKLAEDGLWWEFYTEDGYQGTWSLCSKETNDLLYALLSAQERFESAEDGWKVCGEAVIKIRSLLSGDHELKATTGWQKFLQLCDANNDALATHIRSFPPEE